MALGSVCRGVKTGSADVDQHLAGDAGLVEREAVLAALGADPRLEIAGGRVPLVLQLLSPAQRPIQITRDLPGFWRGFGFRRDSRQARNIPVQRLVTRP